MNIRPRFQTHRECAGTMPFGWFLAFGITVVAAFILSPPPAQASDGKRVALVIGNSDYEYVSKLANPANDASDIADALARIGFEVTSGFDLGYREMRLAIRDFAETADDAEMVFIYFAGHGIEIDNTNYLIPSNAELRSDRDVDFEAIRLDTLIGAIAHSPGLKVVLVDACRNNPFIVDMIRSTATRSIGRGLGRIEPGGVLVGYAARSGTLALDGEGRNSPYAQALLNHIEEPGLEIGKMFRKIRDNVYDLTNGSQEPFTYGSLPGRDIFLVPAPAVSTVDPVVADPPPPSVRQRLFERYSEAQEMGTLKAWNEFLRAYGHKKDEAVVLAAREARDKLVARSTSTGQGLSGERWLDVTFDSTGAAILSREQGIAVQRALSYLGHDTGTPDGVLGPKTRAAIAAARLRAGIPHGSKVDRALLRVLPDVSRIDALKSVKARKYDIDELPKGLEPRLAKAMVALDGYEFIFDYYKGHLYVAVLPGGYARSWKLGNDLAKQAGGYLATISDAEENRFLSDLFRSDERFLEYYAPANELNGPYFGLYQIPGSQEPAGGWVWVTGEPVTFRAWADGHPRPEKKSDYAAFNVLLRTQSRNEPLRTWASNSPDNPKGYLIEIE